jgi:hypothetical protein
MRVWIGLIFCALLAGGCGDEPTRPADIDLVPKRVRVELAVELSSSAGSPGSPITVKAIVRNRGEAQVDGVAYANCACDGVEIEIRDPAGERLLRVPCVPQPVCLCDRSVLQPGTTYERSQSFAGLAYRIVSQMPPECLEEEVASGDYTAVVRYIYTADDGSDVHTLEQRATFRWTGP